MRNKKHDEVLIKLTPGVLNQALMVALRQVGLKDKLNIDIESQIWAEMCDYFDLKWDDDE